MIIAETRFLRGPNLYAATPCLLALVEAGGRAVAGAPVDAAVSNPAGAAPALPDDIPGLGARLLALLPVMPPDAAARLADCRAPLDALAPLTMELQRAAGAAGAAGAVQRTIADPARPGRARVVVGYAIEQVADAALRAALGLIAALAMDDGAVVDVDVGAILAALRDTAREHGAGAGTAAVLAAARARGIPVRRLDGGSDLFQLGWGARQRRLRGTLAGAVSEVAAAIAADPALARTVLARAGCPVPAGEAVATPEAASAAAQTLLDGGGRVTVKSRGAGHARAAHAACATLDAVRLAFDAAAAGADDQDEDEDKDKDTGQDKGKGRGIVVERRPAGRDYRILVAGDAVAAASLRRPPHVTGDGRATVRALVEAENRNPARGVGHANILTRIPLDDAARRALAAQGLDLDAVPAPGATVELRADADLSTGGTAEDVTDLVLADTRALCLRAARAVGLDVAGIDIVCADIARPLADQGGAIVGVDAAPGIRMHETPSRGTPRGAGAAILKTLYARGDGRIPLVAVAGTNGKTTTTLLVAQAARLAGRRTGVATTEGVFIEGERLRRGDATGALAAHTVLASPDVDFAVLEAGRAGILREGLGFDACDVAVVLNVSADRLGRDGIDGLDDLARVQGVVAASARRAVVLNADDERCASLAAGLDPAVEVLYFALDAENPVLVNHLERGGRAAYLQNDAVVLARRARHDALIGVRAMPATLKGAARYNIANGLAAAAALCAAGFSNDDIAAGLRSFVSDLKHNPLRSNVFDVDGVTVIVDAAHNAAAYAALAEAAREMTPGRVAGVVAAPGDRRDADLVEIGVVCAAGFDELVIYEAVRDAHQPATGRAPGDVARLLCEGARAGKFDPVHLQVEPDVQRAIRAGLARCLPGDVLVVGCAASINDLLDAIRTTSPATARRIATRMA